MASPQREDMVTSTRVARGLSLLLGLGVVACQPSAPREVAMASLAPTSLARVGIVDERYQSYNVEMLEVTGGKFWKPRVHVQRDCCRKHDAGADDHHLRDDPTAANGACR